MVGKGVLGSRLPVDRPLLPDVTAILADADSIRLELKYPVSRFLPQIFAILPRTLAINDLLLNAEKEGTPVSYRSSSIGDPRLFPELQPTRFPPDELARLSDRMIEEEGLPPRPRSRLDNFQVPAGFTYLAQFLNHDMEHNSRRLGRPSDIAATRTPQLNLDSLYGVSPAEHAGLYVSRNLSKFALGVTKKGKPRDLPRNGAGKALIPEPRNDNNLILAQLTALFMRFHNRLIDLFQLDFSEARRQVKLHFHSVIIHDLLPRITNDVILNEVREANAPIYGQPKVPFIPYEFSNAAFRLHTMTRSRYRLNDTRYLELDQVLRFTGEGGANVFPLDPSLVIDWSMFFPAASSGGGAANLSRPIDPYVAAGLQRLVLPDIGSDTRRMLKMPLARLPTLGLVDVYASNGLLPSAQAILRWMNSHGYACPALSVGELKEGILESLGQDSLATETPLFYYLLKEAEVRENGTRLGPLGSRIVAETILGILRSDADSIINTPSWKPLISTAIAKKVLMSDMVKAVL